MCGIKLLSHKILLCFILCFSLGSKSSTDQQFLLSIVNPFTNFMKDSIAQWLQCSSSTKQLLGLSALGSEFSELNKKKSLASLKVKTRVKKQPMVVNPCVWDRSLKARVKAQTMGSGSMWGPRFVVLLGQLQLRFILSFKSRGGQSFPLRSSSFSLLILKLYILLASQHNHHVTQINYKFRMFETEVYNFQS